MINAPALVLTAAGLSAIARGGILQEKNRDLPPGAGWQATNDVFKFWTAILAAAGGIILIDKYNSELASGLATLWIIGAVLSNGDSIASWLSGLAKGLGEK